jgi:hypothetical protein
MILTSPLGDSPPASFWFKDETQICFTQNKPIQQPKQINLFSIFDKLSLGIGRVLRTESV